MDIKLWDDDNNTLYSNIFSVPENSVALLFATGFASEIERSEGSFATEQVACVHKLIMESNSHVIQDVGCGGVYKTDIVMSDVLVDEEIRTCLGPWQLTKCHNFALIGVPGVYRLELNGFPADENTAQVWFSLIPRSAVTPNTAPLFFA